MKQRFKLFRRGNGVFYSLDIEQNKQTSLATKDFQDAQRLVHAKNEAYRLPAINLQIARAYFVATFLHTPSAHGQPNYAMHSGSFMGYSLRVDLIGKGYGNSSRATVAHGKTDWWTKEHWYPCIETV
jgi:hypothetical protein